MMLGIGINQKYAFFSYIVHIEVRLIKVENTDGSEYESAELLGISAHNMNDRIALARGDVNDMLELKNLILPYISQNQVSVSRKCGYFDIPTKEWVASL